MSFEWPEFFIGDVCSVGDGAHSKVDRVQEGIPYLTSKNIGQGVLKLDNYDCVSNEDFERLFPVKSSATRRPVVGDILIGIIGTFGNAYLYKEGDHFGFSSSIGIIRPDVKILCSEFLYYVLTSPKFKTNHLSYNAGSVQGYTNIPTIKKLKTPTPPLSVQKEIASILSSLDNRISLLRETNATLEAIAQTLFKSWFVDFDPVKAKAEGRLPEGMDEATAALFPDSFEESALGLIPKGWRESKIEELLELCYGKALKATERIEGLIPVYGSGGITGSHNEPLINCASIIVGRKGTVGSLFWEDRPFFPIDTVFYVKTKQSLSYCFYLLQTLGLETMNTDAAVPGLNRNNVYRLKFCLPSDKILEAFNCIVSSLREKIFSNQQQIQTLSTLRDTLLPRLISGQLRLNPSAQNEAVA